MAPPRFKGNERVHLKGGLGDFDERAVEINGLPLPTLDRRKFLILLVLVCHSLSLSGVDVPVKVDPAAFLMAKRVLKAIEDYLNGLMPRPGIFLEADEMHVTDVIYEIRRLLDDVGINRNLIENGPSRYGYRLGTPPQNVRLSFILPGNQGVIHLKGRRVR